MIMATEKRPSRVAVVSDQPIYLLGLESLLMSMPDVRLVGEARTEAEAVQLCHLSEPDLLLMDLGGAPGQGRDLAREIGRKWPSITLVLLFGPPAEAQSLAEAEAAAWHSFSRNLSEDEFKAALEQVAASAPPGAGVAGSGGATYQPQPAAVPEADLATELKTEHKRPRYRNREAMTRELTMAGKIQASFLPERPPALPGWDISAVLEPARETSGDFYDFIPLTDHKWGVVMADVTDKGVAAALFMALSSTLIRTYTNRFPTLPGLALKAVSDRILSDTGGSLFVTSLLGILEAHTGRFIYANAGHPPGYMIGTQRGKETIEQLRPTGMALGVMEQAQWRQKVTRLAPGDILVLYTDGIVETENSQGTFFGDDRLLDVVLSKTGSCAAEIQDALLAEVRRYAGNALRQDDIALVIIRRVE